MNADDEIRGPGLYLHVPFCLRKCAYCDFYSLPDGPDQPRDVARYLSAVSSELDLLPVPFAPVSVYIGGGTPTALGSSGLGKLGAAVRDRIDLSRVSEFSCEANPGTLQDGVLDTLRAVGVTRVSIGAQSFHPDLLALLGRSHTASDTERAVREARVAGFSQVGLDLMFAVPGQSADDWRADLNRALTLQPDHLSLYALSLEPGTRLARDVADGRLLAVPDDEAADAYALARELLPSAGFDPYEISNFARPGAACLQNLLYWSGEDYLGVGPAAHSHWKGTRWSNPSSLDTWSGENGGRRFPREAEEHLAPADKAVETLIFGLRRIRGVQRAELMRRTRFDLDTLRGPEIRNLLDRGLLVPAPPDGIRLADSALFISDAVFRDLL